MIVCVHCRGPFDCLTFLDGSGLECVLEHTDLERVYSLSNRVFLHEL